MFFLSTEQEKHNNHRKLSYLPPVSEVKVVRNVTVGEAPCTGEGPLTDSSEGSSAWLEQVLKIQGAHRRISWRRVKSVSGPPGVVNLLERTARKLRPRGSPVGSYTIFQSGSWTILCQTSFFGMFYFPSCFKRTYSWKEAGYGAVELNQISLRMKLLFIEQDSVLCGLASAPDKPFH